MRQIQTVVDALLRANARRATKFMSPTLVVRATRVRYCGGFLADKHGIDIALHIGPPNYAERKFIKDCKRAGEPFPVRKIKVGMLCLTKARAKAKRKSRSA